MRKLHVGSLLAALALIVGLSLASGAVAKSARPFTLSASETFNQFGPVSGSGNSTHLGNTTESGSAFTDFTNFPASVVVYQTVTLTAANGDTVSASVVVTLTDTASPPAGNNYSESGTFTFTGGTGRFAGASGSGTVTGSCTSSFSIPTATCSESWAGTISY